MKKIFNEAILLSLSALLLAGCSSGWSEDPFSKYEEEIKTAKLADKQEVSINSEAILLDVESGYAFQETKEGVFKLTYRLFEKDLELIDFFIEDLDDVLPGAKFDASTGDFIWTPAVDFIVGDHFSKQEDVNLVLLVRQGSHVYEVKKTIQISVYQKLIEPALKITKPFLVAGKLEEGNSYSFEFEVLDPDSLGDAAGLDEAPLVNLFFEEGTGLEAASWIKEERKPEQDENNRALWRFYYSLDLSAMGVDASKSYSLSVNSVSRFGQSSNVEDLSFTINPFLERPATTWTGDAMFSLGERSNFSFRVFNPDSFPAERFEVDFGSSCRSQGLRCRCADGLGRDAACVVEGVVTSSGPIRLSYTVRMTAFGKTTVQNFRGVIAPVKRGN